jgi:hypothetical protein
MRIRDPGWRQFGSGIRDLGWNKVGSGIRDKHPGSATLEEKIMFSLVLSGKEDLHAQLIHEQRVIKIKNHRRGKFRSHHHHAELLHLDISGSEEVTDAALCIFLAVFHNILHLNIGET